MKKRPVALVLMGESTPRSGSGTRISLCPVLGKSSAALVLENARALNPVKIFAALGDPDENAVRPFAEAGCDLIPFRSVPGGGVGGFASAVGRALRSYADRDILVIRAGLPLLTSASLKSLLERHRKKGNAMTILCPPGASGEESVEDGDYAVCVFKGGAFGDALSGIPKRGKGTLPAKNRPGFAMEPGQLGFCPSRRPEELFEPATRFELALAASELRLRKIKELSRKDVSILDPRTTWIDLDVQIGGGTVVYPSVVIEGDTRIGRDCVIHPNVHIMSSRLGSRIRILASTVLEGCTLRDGSQAGPFSRLRPGTIVGERARVGNFVEMKKTVFGARSKASHLSYIGDSEVGEDVNIGAGTITCNYDGVHKFKTEIGSGVFIGSGTELVAPVIIGRKAYVAAGSTITRNVAPGALAIARARQVEKAGWSARQEAKRSKNAPKKYRKK
jgi:bifunctional UDP-N-acetylglucosamine pyrophosphorylase / glucosamine-1-phosphate N-acetyltransferase